MKPLVYRQAILLTSVIGVVMLAACARQAGSTVPAAASPIEGPLYVIAWSPNGKTIAAAAQRGLVLFDAVTLSPLRIIDPEERAESVAYSPDSARLACICGEGLIRIWDARSGHLLKTLTDDKGFTSIAFSPTGTEIAGGTRNGNIKVFDGQGEKLLLTLSGPEGDVEALGFSPDGQQLASGSSLSRTARVWDAHSGRLLQAFPEHSDLFGIAFSPDGIRMASSNIGGDSIKIWNLQTGMLLATVSAQVVRFAFSPDGKALVCACKQDLVAWNADDGRRLGTIAPVDPSLYTIAFSPDGQQLAVGTREGRVKNFFWKAHLPPNEASAAATTAPASVPPTPWPTPDKPALEQLLVRYMSQHPPAEFSQLMRNGRTEGYWQELGQVQDSAVQAYIVPAFHPSLSTADWPIVIASVYDNGFTRASVLFDGREGQWHTQELPYTTDARVSQALCIVRGTWDELIIAYGVCGSCSATSIAFDLWRWNGTAFEQIWTMPLTGTKFNGVLSFGPAVAEPGRTVQITYSSWGQMDSKSRLFAESNRGQHRYFTETWERDGDAFHLTETRVQPSAYNALVEFVAALRSGDDATAKQWATDPTLMARGRDLGLTRMPEGALAFPPACYATPIEECNQWQIEWSGSPRLIVGLVQQGGRWRADSVQAAPTGTPTTAVTLQPAAATLTAAPSATASLDPSPDPTLHNTPQGRFPFPLGTTWVYYRLDYHQVVGDSTQLIAATSLYTETVVRVEGSAPSRAVLLERMVSQVTTPPGWESWTILEPGQYRYRIEDNQVLEARSADRREDILLYDFPLQVDKRWCVEPRQPANASGCSEMGRREVQGRSSYTTAVGAFDECYKIMDQYYTGDREWFCAGIGVVARKYDHSGTRYGYDDTLVSFSMGPSLR